MPFPIFHEIFTTVSIGAKVTIGTVCRPLDKNISDKFYDGAGNDLKTYFDTSLIGGGGKTLVQALTGDAAGAKATASNVGKAFVDTVDKTPVLGHAKGVGHLVAGDTKGFKKCMKDATRTTAVVGSAVATGGGSLVVAGAASAACGVAYDFTISKATNEKYGIMETVEQANGDVSCCVDVAMSVGADFVTGAVAARTTQKFKDNNKRANKLRLKLKQKQPAAKSTAVVNGNATRGSKSLLYTFKITSNYAARALAILRWKFKDVESPNEMMECVEVAGLLGAGFGETTAVAVCKIIVKIERLQAMPLVSVSLIDVATTINEFRHIIQDFMNERHVVGGVLIAFLQAYRDILEQLRQMREDWSKGRLIECLNKIAGVMRTLSKIYSNEADTMVACTKLIKEIHRFL